MIRYFYCFGLLVIGTGSPLSARDMGSASPASSRASNADARDLSVSVAVRSSAVAQVREQKTRKSEVTLTPDTSRATVSLSPEAKQKSCRLAQAESLRVSPRVAKNSSLGTRNSPAATDIGPTAPVNTDSNPGQAAMPGRLARVTAYWAAEGDYYTERCISSTGVRLHEGHCAVDPSIIPYGSVVEIAGVGKYLAVDTGSAVISRTAAREGGHTSAERGALVIDLFFAHRSEGEKFAASAAKYASISWWTPDSTGLQARAARSLFAEENWSKIQSKQL
jgi:3D (Asp-Asp-Asp) domain-containing protein